MNTKRKNLLKKYIVAIFMIAFFCVVLSIKVYAAEATVTFGSEKYEYKSGEEFPVGVYINGDSQIANYYVELKYDNLRLRYISGADGVDEENGVLFFEGNSSSEMVKFWIVFEAISGGETYFKLTTATVTSPNGDKFTMTLLQEVPVYLAGEDIVQKNEENGETNEVETQQEFVEIESQSADTVETKPSEIDSNEVNIDKLYKKHNSNGIRVLYFVRFVAIIFGLIIVIVLCVRNRKYIKKRKKKKKYIKQNSTMKRKMYDNKKVNNINHSSKKGSDECLENSLNTPIIKVDNVTMKYKVATSAVTGLKDYIIQKLKKKINVREFLALDGVSFDVFKGEVVGIIGTNGSGKSTLLKIVSGALNPSKGQVIVDRNKIQLLTLGAGFDTELSAKENVYLNGAIIGYSKEFIDEHYDEIVKFAELEGFMDEKVKNFSSGMVSRLGFAIATVGDAAEILILDEVLSVGDEFFKKKSLARVKEMIHGGSTVLMVSHGIGTIISNCTKVVWIEKGKLQMVGDADIVCAAYRRQYN